MKKPLHIFQSSTKRNIAQADFHMHTTWTDGAGSVVEMHNAAVSSGLAKILFSEHARATSGDWFPKFASEVRALPRDHCEAFVGAEVKILNHRGDIDICEEVRRECALVMASVHRFPGEISINKGKESGYSYEEAIGLEFELARAGLLAGTFDILGHPFGMAFRRFGFIPPDNLIRELMRECARTNIAFEVNARYHANPTLFIAWCKEEGAPISLGSNAHGPEEVGALQRIVMGRS